MKMILRIFFVFCLLILLPAFAFSQGPQEKRGQEFFWGKGPEFRERKGMMGRMHGPMIDWARRLNLTEEQTIRLQKLRESYLRDTLVLRNELVIGRFDLKDLLENPQAEPDQVLAKQREVSSLESKLQERTVLYQLEMRQVLTPEQIKLLPPAFGFRGLHGPRMMPGWGREIGRE